MNESSSNATRVSLLSRARQRQSGAWNELVDLYGPLIAHWCRKFGLDSHQSADLVQEVFIAVSRALPDYRAQRANGAFRAWLWTITSNKIKDHYRRVPRQITGTGGSTAMAHLNQVAETTVPTEEPTSEEELSDLVARGLEQVRGEFEPRTWDMFRRVVIDQLPTAIVAGEFCVSPAAVRQARSRVLRRLRQQLGDIEI